MEVFLVGLKVKVTTFALLFHRNTAAMVFDAYIAAEGGDPSGLALMSLAYDFVVPSSFVWGDLAVKAVSADYDTARDHVTELDPPGLILGAPMQVKSWFHGQCPHLAAVERITRAVPCA